MQRLIFSDLRAGARIWFGIFIATVAAAFATAFATAVLETGSRVDDSTRDLLNGMTSVMGGFTIATMIIVLMTLANLTVGLQQRNYALWQLVGILPSRVASVVLWQLTIVAALGASVGTAIAMPIVDPALRFLLAEVPTIAHLHLRFPLSVPWAVGMIVVLIACVVLGGLKGALLAGRTAPIDALRTPEPDTQRFGVGRRILSGYLALNLAMNLVLMAMNQALAALLAPSVALLIVGLVATAGGLLYSRVLGVWVRLIPSTWFPSWYLARHSSEFRLGQSHAAVAPLTVGIALTGGLLSAIASLTAYFISEGEMSPGSTSIRGFVLAMGGPLLLTSIAAAASIFMSSRAREREFALMQATGAAPKVIIRVAILESMIYTVTAVLLGLATIVVAQLLLSAVLATPFTITLEPVFVVAGGGFVLLLLANVLPTVSSIRKPLPRTLAVS